MTGPAPATKTRPLTLALIGALLCLGLLIRLDFMARYVGSEAWGYDYRAYHQAAGRLLDGQPLYSAMQLAGPYPPQRPGLLYLYPPFLATAVIPLRLAVPDEVVATGIWALIQALAIMAAVILIGRRLWPTAPRWRYGGLAVGALLFPPTLAELILGNCHGLLLLLFVVTALAVERRTVRADVAAGLGLALMALIKLFPAGLLVWCVLNRRFRVVGAALAAGLGLVALYLPVTGLGQWFDSLVAIGHIGALTELNDALSPTAWLSLVLPFGLARLLVFGLAGLAVVALARVREPFLALSASLAWLTLTSPGLFHHYVVLLIPAFLVVAARGDRRLRAVALLAFAASFGGVAAPVSGILFDRILPTLGVLAITAAVSLVTVRSGAPTGAPAVPDQA